MQSSNKKEKKQNSPAILLLRRKMVLLIASFALLVALIVAGTAAWYTRVSEVSGMTMDVASFDFSADYVTSTFLIKANDYITDDKIAPGSSGVIPVKLSAASSDLDVDYSLNLDFGAMAPEFRERLCFYYYTYNNSTHKYERHYLTNGSADLTGTIPGRGTQYEYICWKWIYELSPKCYYTTTAALDGQAGVWNIDKTEEEFVTAIGTSSAIAIKAHDEFDTKIGLNTDNINDLFVSRNGHEYKSEGSTIAAISNSSDQTAVGTYTTITAIQKAMEFKILISGVGAQPMTDSSIRYTSSYATTTVPACYFNEYGSATVANEH